MRKKKMLQMIVELDLVSSDSISNAFSQIREKAGEPDVLVYNAGYLEGRDLPPEKELLEHIPLERSRTCPRICVSTTSQNMGPARIRKDEYTTCSTTWAPNTSQNIYFGPYILAN